MTTSMTMMPVNPWGQPSPTTPPSTPTSMTPLASSPPFSRFPTRSTLLGPRPECSLEGVSHSDRNGPNESAASPPIESFSRPAWPVVREKLVWVLGMMPTVAASRVCRGFQSEHFHLSVEFGFKVRFRHGLCRVPHRAEIRRRASIPNHKPHTVEALVHKLSSHCRFFPLTSHSSPLTSPSATDNLA